MGFFGNGSNEKNMPEEFEDLTETFTADGLEEQEARDKAYLTILPKLRKDLQSIHLDRLLRIAQMKKDLINKQIMKTKDAFVNDDSFDPEEALRAAVDKRKFLMKRLFGDTRYTNALYSRFQFAFEKSLRMFVCKFGMFVAKFQCLF